MKFPPPPSSSPPPPPSSFLPCVVMSNICRHGFPPKLIVPFSFSFKHLLLYSTSVAINPPQSTTHFMVDYLRNSLGFSKDEAMTVSTNLTHLKTTQKPDSVLHFFKELGLEETQIKYLVCCRPRLLTTNVEKTVKPKVRVFQDLGLSGSELGDLIVRNPLLFTRGLNGTILPSLRFLQTLFGNKQDVIKAIKKSKWLISCNVEKRMQPNVVLLQNCGVSSGRIGKLISDNPRFFLLKPSRLQRIIDKVEGEFSIPRDSWMFTYAIDVVSSLSIETMELKFGVFESFGWLKSDVITMVRNLPYCLSLSESKIRRALDFLMKELGYIPEYIASHPKLLMYSLEKRVAPRNAVLRVLKEKKLIKRNPSLYQIVSLPEAKFMKGFLLPFKNEVPDVYETYIKSTTTSTTN